MPPLRRKATEPDWLPTPSASSLAAAGSSSQRSTKRQRSDDIVGGLSMATGSRSAPGTPKKSREKRLARFRSKCPQNILERVDRVLSQRFFMVDRRREGKQLKEEFNVLGSTGNVYTVTIDHLPSCSCPDALKGNHCKHILFIFLKVLQVPQSSGHWYQKALLDTELEAVFTNAPPAPSAIAHPSVVAAYARATGKPEPAGESSAAPRRRVPGEGDDCPVCYESMHGAGEKTLTFCDACGNALHAQCFEEWARAATKLTCVWCRAKWVVPSAEVGGGSGSGAYRGARGYLNLGRVAGLSPVRDSSSYYSGPTRGQRYGYSWDDDDGDDDDY